MPYSSSSTPPDPTASVAYGMGSLRSSSPNPRTGASAPKPDWSNSYFPPPNFMERLDFSYQASFNRKFQIAALIEEIVLAWLKNQFATCFSSPPDMAKLNLATSILYRLIAAHKAFQILESELTTGSADVQPALNPEPRTPSSAPPPPPPADPAPPSPINPQSAIRNPQSPSPNSIPSISPVHAVHSVHAVHAVHAIPDIPALTPDDAFFNRTLSMLSDLTGSADVPSADPLPPANNSPDSPSALSLGPRTASSAPSPPPASNTPDSPSALSPESPTSSPASPFAHVHPVHPVHPSPNPQPAPSFSPTPNPQPTTPNSPPTTHNSQPSNPTPQFSCPNPSSPQVCVMCEESFCPARIAVPLDAIACSGACSFCPTVRGCKWSPARLRSPP